MSLIDCLTKHGITDDTVHDHILGISKKYQKQGMTERDADIRAVRDIQEKTIDSLHSVYRQVGIKGYELKREQPYTSKSGKYSVEYQDGKRLVRNNETKEIVPEYEGTRKNKTVYNVLKEHDENYKYNFGEKANQETAPKFNHPDEADKWVIEHSSNPSEVATVYDRTPKEPSHLSATEQAIADHGLGKIKESSYREFGDVNNINNAKARSYFNSKGQNLDVIAKEISDHTGLDVHPEDLVNFIDRFPNGVKQATATRDGEVRQAAASKFKDLTGIDITDRIAQKAAIEGMPKEAEAKADKLIETGQLPQQELHKWLEEEAAKIYEEDNTENNNFNYEPDEPTVDANAASEHQNDIRADASREKGTTTSESLLQGDAVRPEQQSAELGSDKGPTGEERQIPETSPEEVALMGGTIPYVNEFIKEDVAPVLEKTKLSFKDLVRTVVNTLSPKTGVSEKAITHLMKALGGRTEAMAEIDKTIGGFQKAFDRMKDSDRIDFVDRYKKGEQQQTPELQEIANMISGLDKQLYDQIAEFKPTLTWKENHFRVLWKVVPGSKSEKLWSNLTRRPFQGSKGFMKQSTLADMNEGLQKGGEPASTNPIKMFKLAYGDGMKYVTAQRMFEGLKSDKMVQFVNFGDKAPEGFVPIDDRIAKVYYPTPEGLVNRGEYYIEEGAGRLLNNHLSRDRIRESKFGTGLMEIKNLYTATELGLSGFHAIAEGLETVSSEIGLGLRKMINLGVKGDFKSAAEGLKDILTSFKAPVTTFSSGRKGIRFATEQGFENSKFGQEFLKKVPDAKQYIHDYFTGGGIMNQHEDYKLKTIDALKEQAGKNNYIGAALRALPAMNEMILNPLFETYIPALKFGMFMKEFPVTLKENEQRLLKGQTTREELARKSVSFIEDRLGEMNFDNLFWKRTFKTSMQLAMRSVTWKLGNLRGMLGAPVEQAQEFINAAKEKRAPLLMPKMAWLFGLATMQVVLATAIQKMAAGKNLETFKDVVAPQMNPDNDKERVILPTYFKDFLHMWHSKLGYITGSMSGNISKLYDIWQNKDFYGYEIHDEHAPFFEKRKDDLLYFLPKPFSFTSAAKMIDKGEPASKVAMSFIGLNKAPGYLTHSDIENEIFDLYNIRNTSLKPKAEKEANDAKKEIRELYKTDKQAAEDKATDYVKKGLLRPSQIKFLFHHIGQAEDPSVFFFKELPFEDKKYLFDKMTDEEKKTYDPRGTLTKQLQAIKQATSE